MTVQDFIREQRELLDELEQNDGTAVNPNDVSQAAEDLRGLAIELDRISEEVRRLRFVQVDDVVEEMNGTASEIESLAASIRESAEIVLAFTD